jgi:lysyl-tRNA synthetase class 2
MSESEIRKTRLGKVQAMRDAGIQPFEYRYQPTHTAGQLQTLFEGKLNLGEEDITFGQVAVAGRIMIKRVFGKLAFFTMQDESGTIQLQLEKNRLGDTFEVCRSSV